MLELLANAAMSAKADEACNAPYGERDEGRVNSRNGYRERGLSTAAGDVTLKIPKLRRGSFFPEDLIERYCRVDRALVAAVAEMYVMGISTRKVEAVAGELGVRSMSKSQVPRLCECLDAEVDAFRRQRFDGCASPTWWLDATYVKCRAEGRSASQAVVTAIGLDDTGPQALRRRGLRGHGEPRRVEGVPLRPEGARRRRRAPRRLGRPRRAREGDSRDVPRSGLAALRHAPHAQRGGPHPQEGRPEKGARGHEGRLRAEEPRPRAGVLPRGDRGGAEDLEGGRKRALGGRGGGPLASPGVPRPRTAPRSAPTTSRRGPTARSSAGRASCRGSPRASRSSAWWERRSSRPDEEWSARCVISRPSLAHAWKAQEREAPGEAEVLAAREAARKIIGSAIDPKEDEG